MASLNLLRYLVIKDNENDHQVSNNGLKIYFSAAVGYVRSSEREKKC